MKSIPSNRIAKIAIRFAIFKNFFWLRFDSNRLPDPSNQIAIFKSIICLAKIDWNCDFRFDFTLILVIFDLKIAIPVDFFQQIDMANRFQINFCGKIRFGIRFFVHLDFTIWDSISYISKIRFDDSIEIDFDRFDYRPVHRTRRDMANALEDWIFLDTVCF